MIRPVSVVILLGLTAFACAPEEDCLEGECRNRRGSSEDGVTDEERAAQSSAAALLACTTGGKPHIGLGGEDLAAKIDGALGADRARVKPYSALKSEYRRVLGSAPALLDKTGPTFGVPADRWFLEPIASAVVVSTAFEVAFEGCRALTGKEAKYATAPTKDAARTECGEWARRFWTHEATPEQLDACVAVALEDAEKRGWTYACASVLTSTGFLTY